MTTKEPCAPIGYVGTDLPDGFHRTKTLLCTTERARREGTRGGWLWERELTTQRLPGPPLWVLSWRDKKVPPPAGTGSIVVLSGCIQQENPRLSVYNWFSAGLSAGFLRRVSFLFRQERHERTDIGEALCVLLPQSKPPSPMYPTRPHRRKCSQGFSAVGERITQAHNDNEGLRM